MDDVDTRWGLTTLLILSGAWASFHVGRLVVPTRNLKITFYILGLIVGLATVGSWLHFCSAYASESYHRNRVFRVLAIIVFLSIISVKVTSPIHGLYFTAAFVTSPFPHLQIQFGVLHWTVTGLAYSLSAIGFYILYDLFDESGYATTRLAFLVGLAGLPVLFDLIGYVSKDVILTFNYEPIGVALFAFGVLYVADGTFIGVKAFGREQLIDELEEAIVLLDTDGIIRDVNASAIRLFPELSGSTGTKLERASPEIAEHLPVDAPKRITTTDTGGTRHYLLTGQELQAGQTTLGQALVFTDISSFIDQRQEIERQQSQLDDIAEAITHELRNTLNITQGHIDLAHSRVATDADDSVLGSLETATRMTNRMEALVSDLALLAELGHSAQTQEQADIGRITTHAFASIGGDTCELRTDVDTVVADRERLEHLFEKLFTFAIANGATQIEVSQQNESLTVTGDGESIPVDQIDSAFAYGEAVPDAETGMLLPVARTLAEAHGWEMSIDPDYESGVRVIIRTSTH